MLFRSLDYGGINITIDGGSTNWSYTKGYTSAGATGVGATGIDIVSYNTKGKQISFVAESEINIF